MVSCSHRWGTSLLMPFVIPFVDLPFRQTYRFFGITLGMLVFGQVVDRVGRKQGMFIVSESVIDSTLVVIVLKISIDEIDQATSIVAVFATMLTLAWAPSVQTMLSLMIVYRF